MQIDQLPFFLYAKTPLFRNRIAQAQAIVTRALGKADDWFIAVSGGKDSTCVLSLVRTVQPSMLAVSSVQEWCLPETTAYLASIDNLHKVASGSDHGTGWAPNWHGKDVLPDDVTWIGERGMVLPNYGLSKNGVFIGLREQEANYRRVHLRTHGILFFNKKTQIWQCNPLAKWTVFDVWAYIFTNKVPYNHAYDRLTEIGIKRERQRIGPLAVDRAMQMGQLATLRRGWPDLWKAYVDRHPEAARWT